MLGSLMTDPMFGITTGFDMIVCIIDDRLDVPLLAPFINEQPEKAVMKKSG
jgi:hypothetical protein